MILELVKAPHWSRYDFYFRRKPDYSTNTPARAAARLRFTEAAISQRGAEMTEELPPAAMAVSRIRQEKPIADTRIAPLNIKIEKEIINKKREDGASPAPLIRR